MKYMILTYASQHDYDAMTGKPGGQSVWKPQDFAAMGAFMEAFNRDLAESGELVETRGLTAPVHKIQRDERIAEDHRLHTVRAHLLEMAGDRTGARESYLQAARRATNLARLHFRLIAETFH